MTEFAVFDVGRWPIVNVKLSGVPEDMIEFEDYLKGFDLLYEKKREFSLIIDSTEIGAISAYHIARQAFHMYSNENNTKKYVKKVALIITSDSVRKLLNGLFQMRKPVCEVEIFKCLDDCHQWIKNDRNKLIKNEK
jgi:hypothetical protein